MLILGLIREQKWDFALQQKATELGVDEIVPVQFQRNVVKITPDKEAKKCLRWQKICEDAAEQSHRTVVPVVHPVISNIAELAQYKNDVNLVCWENGTLQSLKHSFIAGTSFTFVVGLEGGLEASEITKLEQMGYTTIKFSNNIFRAETVPLFLLSALSFNFE